MSIKKIFFVFSGLMIMAVAGGAALAANPDKCEPAEEFLILKNQQYALCANATCTTLNQVAYCGCDLLKGNSISLPFDFGDGEDVCTVNQDGRGNGYRVSTYSVPKRSVFPEGDYALYTCPGELNKDKYGGVAAASGSYAQCDGGLCFMSTKGRNFPGLDKLGKKELVCSCPITTNCEGSDANPEGHQIGGPYDGVNGCDPNACLKCDAARLTDAQCETSNPANFIGVQENVPVGSAAGTPAILSCLLLDGDVPRLNSCFCSCDEVNEDGSCAEWSVHDESPLDVHCGL